MPRTMEVESEVAVLGSPIPFERTATSRTQDDERGLEPIDLPEFSMHGQMLRPCSNIQLQ